MVFPCAPPSFNQGRKLFVSSRAICRSCALGILKSAGAFGAGLGKHQDTIDLLVHQLFAPRLLILNQPAAHELLHLLAARNLQCHRASQFPEAVLASGGAFCR